MSNPYLTKLPSLTTITDMRVLADKLRQTTVEVRPLSGGPFRTVKYVVLFSAAHHIPYTAEVYAVRPIPDEIAQRVKHARPNFAATHVQVEIQDGRDRRWINVRKGELVHATPPSRPCGTAKTDRLPVVH